MTAEDLAEKMAFAAGQERHWAIRAGATEAEALLPYATAFLVMCKALEEMLQHGTHEGDCTNSDSEEWCEKHVEAMLWRQDLGHVALEAADALLADTK